MNDLEQNPREPEKVPRRRKGTGSIYQRPDSPVWWLKFSRWGKPYRESTGTTDQRKAEKLLRKRLAEIETGIFAGPVVERVRMEELYGDVERDYRINGRKSADDLRARWTLHLNPFFGVLRAVDVTSNLITRYVDARQQQEASNATINRELAVLKRMFHLGQQSTPPKVLRVPHIAMMKENNVRVGFLEPAQYDRLAAACAKIGLWLRAMFELGCTYGWRHEEVLGLQVRQVNLLAGTIRLEPLTTKNDDGREVTLTQPLRELLAQCMVGKAPDDFLFTRGKKPVREFRDSWARACERAGVPGLLYHDLRRTAARAMRRAGIAEGVIMKIGGWKTRSVFERYAIVDQSDIRDAMHKLEAMRQSDAAQQRDQAALDKSRIGHVEDFGESQPSAEAVN